MDVIKKFLAIVFICGWLAPKLLIGGFNFGIQEVAAVFLLIFNFKINKKIVSIFHADLVFSFFLFLLGVFYLFKFDVEGFLIGSRTFLFVLAVIGFTSFQQIQLQKIMNVVLLIYSMFLFFSISRILFNFLFNPFDILNFFYGSDSYRIRAPFEPEGAASSQVPIGYLISFVLCIPHVGNSILNKFLFILGAIGTTSRAAILSVFLVYLRRIKFNTKSILFSIMIFSFFILIIFFKSTISNDGELDGSGIRRLELYFHSFNKLIENPYSLFTGFGLSFKLLESQSGEGFYESFLINSLMQGGLPLGLCSIWIIFKSFYYDIRYNLYSIGIVIFIGNAIGGSNYFSMFAYPFMGLIISYAVKSQNKITYENSSFDHIK